MTKIAFYGSSLLSSYWNGAATYYRGLIRQLAMLGYEVTFYEPNVYERQKYRDICPPNWCKVVVYDGTRHALRKAAAKAAEADVVVKASGVGFEDDLLMDHVLAAARPDTLKIYWDVDAPATLAELGVDASHALHKQLRGIDIVLTYGGGERVVEGYRRIGATECVPIYNALDADTHHPVRPETRFSADLAFLGNRLPDREARVDEFFFKPATILPEHAFLLGGSGWDDKPRSKNAHYIGHVSTRDHNAFNASPKAVLNVNRASMADNGFSPATRIFEAAGAGACIITDPWAGIELFLKEGEEVLVARNGEDVAELLAGLQPAEAAAIGRRARQRILREHTYAHRAAEVHRIISRYVRPPHAEAAE